MANFIITYISMSKWQYNSEIIVHLSCNVNFFFEVAMILLDVHYHVHVQYISNPQLSL